MTTSQNLTQQIINVTFAAELKDFNPQDFMDRKAAKRMEPFSQYAVAAAKQAN